MFLLSLAPNFTKKSFLCNGKLSKSSSGFQKFWSLEKAQTEQLMIGQRKQFLEKKLSLRWL